MFSMPIPVLACALAFATASVALAAPLTLYVSPDGNGAWSGRPA